MVSQSCINSPQLQSMINLKVKKSNLKLNEILYNLQNQQIFLNEPDIKMSRFTQKSPPKIITDRKIIDNQLYIMNNQSALQSNIVQQSNLQKIYQQKEIRKKRKLNVKDLPKQGLLGKQKQEEAYFKILDNMEKKNQSEATQQIENDELYFKSETPYTDELSEKIDQYIIGNNMVANHQEIQSQQFINSSESVTYQNILIQNQKNHKTMKSENYRNQNEFIIDQKELSPKSQRKNVFHQNILQNSEEYMKYQNIGNPVQSMSTQIRSSQQNEDKVNKHPQTFQNTIRNMNVYDPQYFQNIYLNEQQSSKYKIQLQNEMIEPVI